MNYTYLVIGRGPRPASKLDRMFSEIGRLGGVGKEVLEKEAVKMEGKSELREVEGGEFEMVSLARPDLGRDVDTGALSGSGSGSGAGAGSDEVVKVMRDEAYKWPRVVAPPMKRAGHVILDTCFPDGMSPIPHHNGQRPRTWTRTQH